MYSESHERGIQGDQNLDKGESSSGYTIMKGLMKALALEIILKGQLIS